MSSTTVKDKITVKVNGEDREIFMSFGLLNSVTKIVYDMQMVATMALVPELREDVLKQLLAKRTPSGKVTAAIDDIDEIDISIDDVVSLLDWTSEHLLDFFLKALDKAKSMADRNQARMTALMPSGSGSPV
jgi:hypothetical protein